MDVTTIGICCATSTPKWLMQQCREAIINGINTDPDR